jgi:hypothetical protein
MGKTRMQARSARTRTLALTHYADVHVHRASASLVLYPCLIQVVFCRVLSLCAPHPLPIPRGPSCPLARHEWL